MSNTINDNLVLISGESATGKSACLMNLKNPEGVMYLGCEAGKKLPFKAKFMKGPDGKVGFTITDPYHVYDAFAFAETDPKIHTIVIDTVTFLMEMFESVHVLGSENTMAAWGHYAQFFKNLMQQHVAKSTKNVIFLAHTADVQVDEITTKKLVKVKGSLMNNGIEAFFSTVISTKKVSLKNIECENPLLNITKLDERRGFKYVFQTAETANERIRAPLGMWEEEEEYIDNDVQHVLDKLHWFYDED